MCEQARATWSHRLAIAAVVAAGLMAVALACRTNATEDLGYHLAYGEHALATGRIVDGPMLVHPPPAPDGAEPWGLPPGAWFDQAGRYHFVNANWLTQVLMAGVHDLAGPTGLTLLGVALVVLILGGLAGAVRQAHRSWLAVALAWLVFALIGYERFNLRPELFAYACLAWQAALLTGRPRWSRLVAVVILQVLAVNVHGYWLLGVAMAVLFMFRSRRHAALPLVMLAAGLVHPFGWRNFVFPFQTARYLAEHAITGARSVTVTEMMRGQVHPWATIAEFRWPFTDTWSFVATGAFAVALGLVIPAAVLLVARRGDRRWGWMLGLILFAVIGCQMRRNIATAAVVVGPALAIAFTAPRAMAASVIGRVSGGVAAVVIGLVALAGLGLTVTDTWYEREHAPWRFGVGLERDALGLDAAAWLDDHLTDTQPVFTTLRYASNLAYFSRRVEAVPLLSNTWAMTPRRFQAVMLMAVDTGDVEAMLGRWGYATVVAPDCPLADRLRQAAAWRQSHRTAAGLRVFQRARRLQ